MLPNKYHHITDKELLEKFWATNDNYWLGILLQRYTLLLFGTCMKYLKNEEAAKDAVQQICLKSITELSKYKVDYFKSWLYMIAKNYCLMQFRNKNIPQSLEDNFEVESQEIDKEILINKENKLNLLEECLQTLQVEQKTCVTLFYIQKQSYQQITNSTGYSLLQVKSNIQNGKRNLKILMDKQLKKQ